jgi:hypothetical protein
MIVIDARRRTQEPRRGVFGHFEIMEERMNEAGEMTNAVDAALERVRGELTTLERALGVLRVSMIDEIGMSADPRNARTDLTGNAYEGIRDWQSLDGLGRALSRLRLPEYGASAPLDEQA